MTVEQRKIIDFIGINKVEDTVDLVISDHLEWDEKNEHLLILQEKINDYLAAIESGEIVEKYPNAEGKKIVIRVNLKYPIPETEMVKKFCEKAISIVQWAGFDLRFEQHEEENA